MADGPRPLEDRIDAVAAVVASLQEGLADVEASFAREDAGWRALGSMRQSERFTPEFRRQRMEQARAAAAMDPLLKRATALRCANVWGGGVQVSVRDDATTGQDVGAAVAAFWGDADVQETLSSLQAQLRHERALCTDGEIFLALPTDARTGRVRVRTLPPNEIAEVIYDPEDAARPWFYRRTFTDASKRTRELLYPALSYRPAVRPRTFQPPNTSGEGIEVEWDAPVLHIAVNAVGDRGVGDLWAALPWAKAYLGFLSDWAGLMRALSRIAHRVKTRGDRTQQAAARIAGLTDTGSGVALSHGDELEAVSTSGARFDADSGRPLATMVAAAVDLPVTTLLGDPGVTGARATAETVADESWQVFAARQNLWTMVLIRILDHVIDSAVVAPAGMLRGTIVRDGDRQRAELPEGDSRTLVVAFPERDSTDSVERVKAIVQADQTEKLPPLTVARLLLEALDVPDMDEVLDVITDEQGQFIPLDILDQQVRARLADRGEDAPYAGAGEEQAEDVA